MGYVAAPHVGGVRAWHIVRTHVTRGAICAIVFSARSAPRPSRTPISKTMRFYCARAKCTPRLSSARVHSRKPLKTARETRELHIIVTREARSKEFLAENNSAIRRECVVKLKRFAPAVCVPVQSKAATCIAILPWLLFPLYCWCVKFLPKLNVIRRARTFKRRPFNILSALIFDIYVRV